MLSLNKGSTRVLFSIGVPLLVLCLFKYLNYTPVRLIILYGVRHVLAAAVFWACACRVKEYV